MSGKFPLADILTDWYIIFVKALIRLGHAVA
jgi:hypothetical protein